ncbi:MAG: aspartate aminotransferase family protein [Gammaproteobacteria bacterium]|nr:MAG: aspartate aminotransferase family protein [Gammaproteobacteria bacterium]
MFHRHCHHQPRHAAYGEGAYVVDQEGRRYLDASGGAAVTALGYSHPRVIEAVTRQLSTLPYVHSGFFTTDACEELAEHLVQDAPPGLERVWLVSGGSEAIESALKLARQYFVEAGETQRRWFISRRQSFHGNTLGALAVGGNRWRRAPFEPLLMGSHQIAPCYSYRHQRPDESAEAYAARAAGELEAMIQRLGAENVIGFIAEPVVGATAGAVPPVPGYFRRIREICDRHGILLILDEVMCGMGRTGTLFACEQEGIAPDILTLAKGLGAGYQPIGAVLASGAIFERLSSGSGQFQHGHTYMAHAAAAAAAVAVQQVIRDEDLLTRVCTLGDALMSGLRERFADHPHVGDIRGRGLLLGLELVADRESKTPFPANSQLASRIKQHALELGLMCYPAGGTIDGHEGHHVLLAPPFILQEAELELITDRLARALDHAVREITP